VVLLRAMVHAFQECDLRVTCVAASLHLLSQWAATALLTGSCGSRHVLYKHQVLNLATLL
jgi:hypothetical protein